MTTAALSTALATIQPAFTDPAIRILGSVAVMAAGWRWRHRGNTFSLRALAASWHCSSTV
jgi:hypothetical protein